MARCLRWFWLLLCMGIWAGCATPTAPTATVAPGLWQDAAFGYEPGLVRVDEAALLRLDENLLQVLQGPRLQGASVERRVQYLLQTLVENRREPFAYAGGHSTVAAETWRLRRGDCLSLTVLAYAMSQQLRLRAVIQEVPVPPLYDRRGGIDHRVDHVNLFVERETPQDVASMTSFKRGVVVDFEPSVGVTRLGTPLDARAILARYYNNVAAEHLVRGDQRLAYAHMRAAIEADPDYATAYVNLATLYAQQALWSGAERTLQQALALQPSHDGALLGMARLLDLQGQHDAAQPYRARLAQRQENDPYYWTNLGALRLQEGNPDRAAAALERAQELTTGFAEVHRYLAQAYLLQGKNDKAQEQLTLLAQIDQQDPTLPTLQSKLLSKKLRY